MGSNYCRSCFSVTELLLLCTLYGIHWILQRHLNSKAQILHSVAAVWVSPISYCSCSQEHNISKKLVFFFFFFLDLLGLFLSFQVVFWTVSTASMRAVLWISVSGFLSFMVVVLRYLNKCLHSTSLLLMSISCSVSVILIVVTLLFFVLISIPYIIAVLPSFVIVFAHPGPIPPIKSTSSSKDRLPILLPPTDSTPSKFSESFDIKCSRKQLKGCGNRRHHFLTPAAIWNYLLSVLPSSALLSTL